MILDLHRCGFAGIAERPQRAEADKPLLGYQRLHRSVPQHLLTFEESRPHAHRLTAQRTLVPLRPIHLMPRPRELCGHNVCCQLQCHRSLLCCPRLHVAEGGRGDQLERVFDEEVKFAIG